MTKNQNPWDYPQEENLNSNKIAAPDGYGTINLDKLNTESSSSSDVVLNSKPGSFPAVSDPSVSQPDPLLNQPTGIGFAASSIIIGFLSIPFFILIIPEILAVIFAILALGNPRKTKISLVISLIGLFFSAIGIILLISFLIYISSRRVS